MKHIAYMVVIWLLLIAVVYLFCAFTSLYWNPLEWHPVGRFFFGLLCLATLGMAIYVGGEIASDEKDEKRS